MDFLFHGSPTLVCVFDCVLCGVRSVAVGLVVHDTYMTLFLASLLSVFVCLIVVMFLLF